MTRDEKRAAYIARVVAEAPPLSDEQIDLISVLLRPDADTRTRVNAEAARAAAAADHQAVLAEKRAHAEALRVANEQIDNSKTVYFIRSGNFVKIGISNDPKGRLGELRSGQMTIVPSYVEREAMQIIATEPGGRKRENELHALFRESRTRGEWFAVTPSIEQYLSERLAS